MATGSLNMKAVSPGLIGKRQIIVTEKTLASYTGSGRVQVFSTPNLILLMEEAAAGAVDEYLEPGETTVGTSVNIDHLAPTPVGLIVTATAHLTAVKGRILEFQVEASDGIERIGEGTHTRAVVHKDKFETKAQQKNRERP